MSGAVRFMMMMRHAFPVHQGVFDFFCIAMRECCSLNARGEGLSEDKQQKDSGKKPTHGMKVRESKVKKLYGPSTKTLSSGLVKAGLITRS
ncbi:MAG: hypothetical protein V4711_09825 [Pseudomonadota bacterium]